MQEPANRLKAYTILEITIAMLIVSILTALVYYALQMFSRLLAEQQVQKQEQYGFDLLCHRLRWDSYRADSIKVLDEGALAFIDSTGTVEYLFLDSMVLRTQYALRTDTFHVRSEPPLLEVAPYRAEGHDLVTSFDLPLLLDGETVYLPIQKGYSAIQLIGSIPNGTP